MDFSYKFLTVKIKSLRQNPVLILYKKKQGKYTLVHQFHSLRFFILYSLCIYSLTVKRNISQEFIGLKYTMSADDLFNYVETNKKVFLDEFNEILSIPTVPGVPQHEEDVKKGIKWVTDKLRKIGATFESSDNSPVILATVGKVWKPAVLIYMHLDERPWGLNDSPLNRGYTIGKGPLLCWLHAFQTYQEVRKDIPICCRIYIDSAEEICGSKVESTIPNSWKNIVWGCMGEVAGLLEKSPDKPNPPCLAIGGRGLLYLNLIVSGPTRCLQAEHAGEHAGVVPDPMGDLLHVLGEMQDKKGRIKISGFTDGMIPIGHGDDQEVNQIVWSPAEMKKYVGAAALPHSEIRNRLLLHRWQIPCMSVHGVTGGCSDNCAVPMVASALVSFRIVPKQNVDDAYRLVADHCVSALRHRDTGNKLEVKMLAGVQPWLQMEYQRKQTFTAAFSAIQGVFQEKPQIIRDAGSSPASAAMMHYAQNGGVVALPLVQHDDENGFIDGHKLALLFIHQLGSIPAKEIVM